MKIFKGVITTLPGEGRITLQVPCYNIVHHDQRPVAYTAEQAAEANPRDEVVDAPDEWFIILRSSDGPPAVGKEKGFTFLSRAGWEANKDEIKKAFEGSEHPRGTWKDFENHVEEHFAKVVKSINRRINLFQSKIDQLQKEALKVL